MTNEQALLNAIIAEMEEAWDVYAWGYMFPESEFRMQVLQGIRRVRRRERMETSREDQ